MSHIVVAQPQWYAVTIRWDWGKDKATQSPLSNSLEPIIAWHIDINPAGKITVAPLLVHGFMDKRALFGYLLPDQRVFMIANDNDEWCELEHSTRMRHFGGFAAAQGYCFDTFPAAK